MYSVFPSGLNTMEQTRDPQSTLERLAASLAQARETEIVTLLFPGDGSPPGRMISILQLDGSLVNHLSQEDPEQAPALWDAHCRNLPFAMRCRLGVLGAVVKLLLEEEPDDPNLA